MNSTSANFSRWEYQNIALAAVAQCAALVHQLATRGYSDDADMVAAINPLFATDPRSYEDIYPGVGQLSTGLKTLQDIFGNERKQEHAEIIRYLLGMLILRGKLNSDHEMQNRIRSNLQRIEPLHTVAGGTNEAELDALESSREASYIQLAELYQDTISTLSFRIQVQGKVEHLNNIAVADKIRSLLLAGIRSAVLWYQLGGRRWRLVFYRKRIQESVQAIRRKLIVAV